MSGYSSFLGQAWDFSAAHPFVSAWLAVATAWAIHTFANRDRA